MLADGRNDEEGHFQGIKERVAVLQFYFHGLYFLKCLQDNPSPPPHKKIDIICPLSIPTWAGGCELGPAPLLVSIADSDADLQQQQLVL